MFLKQNDYKTKNLSPDKIILKIPKNLKQYWWRGYFDGDGCISLFSKNKCHVIFSGPINQKWDFVDALFKQLRIKKYRKSKVQSICGQSSKVCISNRGDCFRFLNYIYQGRMMDKIGLNRKYKKYLSINKF